MKVIRKIILTVLALAGAMCAHGRTVVDFFSAAEAPIPLLEANTRLDMADYWRHGMTRESANELGGTAAITQVSVDTTSMRFGITGQVDCQLAMLASGRDTVVLFIETLPLPMADSHLSFYDRNWQPLAKPALTMPVLADWLTPQGAVERADVEAWLPFITARADYDPATRTLTIANTVKDYYHDRADLDRVDRWLKPSLQYVADGRRFKPLKK